MSDNSTEPAHDLWEGHLTMLEICEPRWLYAGQMTDADDGRSWKYVYRSLALRETDEMYRPALDYLGDAVLTKAETIEDDGMMFGAAELSVWELMVDR